MMAGKFGGLLVACITVLAASHTHARMGSEVQGMQMRLHLSERVHQRSLSQIASRMTMSSAMAVLRRKVSEKPLLALILKSVSRRAGVGKSSKNLRALSDPTGYAGLDKAKKMLNGMIEETKIKYDDEREECCTYDEDQTYLMDVCKQDLAMYDEESATARKEVQEADTEIARSETLLPKTRDALDVHKDDCKVAIKELNRQLDIVMADVAVMVSILGMTDCKPQTMLLQSCRDECGEAFVSFGDNAMQSAYSQLQSWTTQQLMDSTLADEYGDQEDPNATMYAPKPTEPPSVMATRSSPCKLPKPVDNAAGKCSISSVINCQKMQNKFENIKCGIEDKQAELEDELAKKTKYCEDTTENSEAEIAALELNLKTWQTNLGAATAKQSNALEGSRKKGKEKVSLDEDWAQTTKKCHTNYRIHESDLCALTKIRTELYKMKGQNEPAFFQDCEVSEWVPEACSKPCAGGIQVLKRKITTHPSGGADCPKFEEERECNKHKCPVDCEVDDWGGWASCNVQCGGGIRSRIRSIKIAPMHGGDPCEDTSMSESCELQACDKECELSDWNDWGNCDKQCDWGLNTRLKKITVQSVGNGYCAKQDDKTRQQEQSCNSQPCVTAKSQFLTCESKLDVVVILDGSGSLELNGWLQTKKGGKALVNSFRGNAGVHVALILFSRNAEVKMHLSSDMDAAVNAIDAMQWPQGVTYTNKALDAAKTEFSLCRADAENVAILFTDGVPAYWWFTVQAAWRLKHDAHARLMVVPVTKWAPMDLTKEIASKPLVNNIVKVDNFDDLAEPKVINNIIADVCLTVDAS